MRIFLSSLFVVFSLVFANSVSAAETNEPSPEKLIEIEARCVDMQVVLQKIQYNDAANRVNRGQGYESLVTRMMIPMNGRTAVNGLSSSAATLAGITTNYQQSLANFKNSYERYDDAISSALRIKCQEKPADFYKLLVEARKQRTNVSNEVATLAQLIEDYRLAVIKLKAEL